jgi:MinD-like ATPase involved in chromosome partitioning or flagellar assembly
LTTDNDTPRVSGSDAGTEDDRPGDWRDLLAEYPAGPGYLPVSGPGHPGYPRPDHPHQPGGGTGGSYPADAGYPVTASYARQVGYPQAPGYEPGEEDQPEGTGYQPEDIGYRPEDAGYQSEGTGYQSEGTGYWPDPGFAAGDTLVPPMEPLPGAAFTPSPYAAAPTTFPPAPQTLPPAAMGPDLGESDPGGGWEDPRAPLPPPAESAPEPPPARENSDSLTTESLLHGKRVAPGSGWRRSVYRATGGLLRFGESAAEMRRRDLIHRVRMPVAGGHHRVAVLSLKGGVGKTTTVVGLGATLATLRGDRVIAVDANPDRGTLSDKVRLETAATVRDLLNERDQVRRYADVRAFTSQAPSRLEVLASDRDPGVSVAFGAEDYCDAARVLEHFYSICITDCGTGLLHSAMSGVLRLADQIVLVSSPSVDGARSASATLDWLEAHNCGDLVRNGVVVLSAIRPRSKSTVDLDRLEHHFAVRCRAVTRIPYDPHLEEGAEVELELLNTETAEAYLTLAAIVGDGLAWPRRMTSRPALP